MSSDRYIVASFLLLVLAIVGGSVMLLATRPQPFQITINPPIPTSTPPPTATPAPLLVYVTGEVVQPMTTVSLSPESRVQDAIAAAGGATDNADLTRVNLAGLLRDGDQVHVPALAQNGQTDETSAEVIVPTPMGGDQVNVNIATLEELDILPGIGPSLAQAIIDHREEFGPFADLEMLDEVPGIGPALLEEIKDLVRFE